MLIRTVKPLIESKKSVKISVIRLIRVPIMRNVCYDFFFCHFFQNFQLSSLK